MSPKSSIVSSHTWRRFTFLLVACIFSAQLSQAQKAPVVPNQKSSFTAKLINLEQARSETFRYNTTLHNGSTKAVIYQLQAGLEPGWMISYKVDGNQITSLNMDAGKTQDISIEINPAADASPKKYPIPVKAIAGTDTLTLNLEAVVKGSYSLTFSSPTGKLNEDLTAGSTKQISLVATNTGTLALENLSLSSQLPTGWECTFEPANITKLEPGKSISVNANLKVPDKTIAGDYVSTFTASGSSANVQTSFRMQVKTSLFSGWVGILVILLAIGIVYYLIKKYGRR
jgi:uncharacterized membrane protein|nr:NEW3 domain-containing protein [uncultured Pedobacter sp.]